MEKQAAKTVFHVDLNRFFASVEEIYDPSLRNKPFVVGGRTKRSVAGSVSYAASKLGAKTAMPIFQIQALSSQILIVEHHFDRYSKYSDLFFAELAQVFTRKLEIASIDECYLDVTDLLEKETAEELAGRLQRHILRKLNLGVSIGISSNRFLAKVASDMKKPLGITTLMPQDIGTVLWPLPIKAMLWVGPATALALNRMGVFTIGELANYPDPQRLREELGVAADTLYENANGRGSDVVDPSAGEAKSIGHSVTLPEDSGSYDEIASVVREIAESIELRALQSRQTGNRISVKLRDKGFSDKSRNTTLAKHTGDSATILNNALRLLDDLWDDRPVRLVGVTLSGLTPAGESFEQLTIHDFERQRQPATKRIVEAVNRKVAAKVVWTGDELLKIQKRR